MAPGAGGDDEVAVGVEVELLLPLDAVSQVHRHGDRPALRVQEPLPADGEQVGDPGEGDRDRMQIDSEDMIGEPIERLGQRHAVLGGRGEIPAHCVEQERARSARRVQNPLLQR